MIEWSWRIEGKRLIWGGSWSDAERWTRLLPRLQSTSVASVSLFARLPEIAISLTNGLHLILFMTAEGDPEWHLLTRSATGTVSVSVQAGRLVKTVDRASYR